MNAYEAFQQCDIRVGTIIQVDDFPEARKPAYKLIIDLGSLGIKRSTAQITHNYTKEQLLNKQVLCLVNIPPRQIGPVVSEVLTLGVPAADNSVVLIQTERTVPLGGKLY